MRATRTGNGRPLSAIGVARTGALNDTVRIGAALPAILAGADPIERADAPP